MYSPPLSLHPTDNYEAGTTVYRILESLLEAVCVLLAVAPVRMKKTGERCYLRPGMRLLATRSEFRMRVKAVERSAVPSGVLAHILPLVQMLAVVPLGLDVPRAGLCLREWAISMSDFHNAKAQGDAEAAALNRLMQARVRRGGKAVPAAAAAAAAPSPKGSVSPRGRQSPGPVPMSPASAAAAAAAAAEQQQRRGQQGEEEEDEGWRAAGGGQQGEEDDEQMMLDPSLSPEQRREDARRQQREQPQRTPPRGEQQQQQPPSPASGGGRLALNTSGGVLHVGATWDRAPTGRASPRHSASQQSPPVSPRSGGGGGGGGGGSSRRDPSPRAALRAASSPSLHPSQQPPATLGSQPPLPPYGLPPLPPPSPRLGGGLGPEYPGAALGPKVVREMTAAEKDALGRLSAAAHDPGHRVLAKTPIRQTEPDFARALSLEAEAGVVRASPPHSPPRRQQPTPTPQSRAQTLQQQESPGSSGVGGGVRDEEAEPSLWGWLAQRGMERYAETLNENGVVAVRDICAANEGALNSLPIGMCGGCVCVCVCVCAQAGSNNNNNAKQDRRESCLRMHLGCSARKPRQGDGAHEHLKISFLPPADHPLFARCTRDASCNFSKKLCEESDNTPSRRSLVP